MNTEKLITDSEVVNSVVESLGDIPQDSSATYDLWVVGYNMDNEPVSELFIYGFDNPEEALNKAETIDFKFIEEQTEMSFADYCNSNNLERVSVEIETFVDGDEEISAGSIYRRDLWLDGEYGTVEDCDICDDIIIAVCKDDYDFLEDGTLRLSAKFTPDLNKNDKVMLQFVDEPDACFVPYKIKSKVIYEDGDHYTCEIDI